MSKEKSTQPPEALSALPVVFALGFALGGVLIVAALALWYPQRLHTTVKNLDLPLPEISLPALDGDREGELMALRTTFVGPALINFWASWCLPCVTEHPVLTAIAAEGVPLYGVLYHDEAAAGGAFLRQYGSPFRQVLIDSNGASGVATGLTGVPETLVIDATGRVKGRWVGLLTETVWREELKPLYLTGGGQP